MLTMHSLDGTWRLGWFEAGRGQDAGAHGPLFNDGGWLPAEVPGEVHRTLQRAGVIRGEQFDRSADEIAWIEKCEWWYRTAFVPDPAWRTKHVELVFDGLDTLATVYLNGRLIARSENMHVGVRCEVGGKLRWGERNVLAVRLAPVADAHQGKSLAGLYTTTTAERLFVRKAQVSFGWDFLGRLVTAGIYRPVRLECWDAARLDAPQIVAAPTPGGGAEFGFHVATRGRGGAVEVAVREAGARTWLMTKRLPGGKGALTLKTAKLWWPFPYGRPNLYEVRVRLLDGKAVLDEQTHRVGVRSVELVQEPIEDGARFAFRINGRDVFIRGSNWVPPTPFYADVSAETYRDILAWAVRGNVEMLRVWGGGVYELDSFYDLCDEMGILVWQDFMWACGVYPDGPAEQKQAAAEAEFQLKRLRNHACIAIWCGDNEDDWAFEWGQIPHERRLAYRLTRKALPAVCKRLDPARPYVPSSPFSPTLRDCNDSREGDQHQYRWNGLDPADPLKHYSNFFQDRSRFVSEFGTSSLPGPETMALYNYARAPIDLSHRWPQMRPPNPPDRTHADLTAPQMVHALFQKRVLEHYRRLWPICGGTLHWKFNDPFSANKTGFGLMASIDPAGAAKMSYYYTKRAYAPVAVSLRQESDDVYSAWVCNQTDRPFAGELQVELYHQDASHRPALRAAVNVPPDTSVEVGRIDLKALGFQRWEDRRDNVAAIFLRQGRREVFYDTFWFMDIPRELKLRLIWGTLTARLAHRRPGEMAVTLRADRFVRPVELLMPGVKVWYDDNFLDLLPGVERTVAIRRWPWDRTTDLRRQSLHIRGWNFKWLAMET